MRSLQQAFPVTKFVNKMVLADLASTATRFRGTVVMGFGGDRKEQVSLYHLLQWRQQGHGVHIGPASDQPTEGPKTDSLLKAHDVV